MLKARVFQIAAIHVPVKRAKTLDPGKVAQIAANILEEGQTMPIRSNRWGSLRPGGGSPRLEAMKALGEKSIDGYLVQARKH